MYMLHRIMGSGFTVNKFFSEFLIYGPTFFKSSTFRVFLSLKYFKKYWFPLLFWVGFFILGMIPRCVQRLGGRKVKSVCLVYDLGYNSFLVFITRLILVVFPRISRVPEKYQSFINGSLIFFGFNCGPIENVYFMRLIKYYMRRIRKALNNNCICRIYLNIFGIDKNLVTRTSYGFKQLTAFRLPIFLDD